MIDFTFDFPTPQQVKTRLAAGYRARRNFLISELFGMIVYGTPVLTGEARGGWRITVGAPTGTGGGTLDPDGTETVLRGLGALKGVGAFQDVIISNGVSYIEDLENGWSGQAPNGMVKVSLAAMKSMYGDLQ